MTTTTATTTPATTVPEGSPSWWLHWLSILVPVAVGVLAVVNPGGKFGPTLQAALVPLSALLAVGSTVIAAVVHAKFRAAGFRAAVSIVRGHLADLEHAASELAPALKAVPGLNSRVAALETRATTAVPTLQDLLDALKRAEGGNPPAAAVAGPGEATGSPS